MSKTTALVEVDLKKQRDGTVAVISVPQRVVNLIHSSRVTDIMLKLGRNESFRVSSDILKKVVEKTYGKKLRIR